MIMYLVISFNVNSASRISFGINAWANDAISLEFKCVKFFDPVKWLIGNATIHTIIVPMTVNQGKDILNNGNASLLYTVFPVYVVAAFLEYVKLFILQILSRINTQKIITVSNL